MRPSSGRGLAHGTEAHRSGFSGFRTCLASGVWGRMRDIRFSGLGFPEIQYFWIGPRVQRSGFEGLLSVRVMFFAIRDLKIHRLSWLCGLAVSFGCVRCSCFGFLGGGVGGLWWKVSSWVYLEQKLDLTIH